MSLYPQPSFMGLITNVSIFLVLITIPLSIALLMFPILSTDISYPATYFFGAMSSSFVLYNILKLTNWWVTGKWEL